MLKIGDKGKEVRELQEKLLGLGYELPKYVRFAHRRLRLTAKSNRRPEAYGKKQPTPEQEV